MDDSMYIGDTVDDPAQPLISSNPAEPNAAGDKEMGTRPDGTTEPMKGNPVEEGEHEYSRTSSEMELGEPDSGRSDSELSHEEGPRPQDGGIREAPQAITRLRVYEILIARAKEIGPRCLPLHIDAEERANLILAAMDEKAREGISSDQRVELSENLRRFCSNVEARRKKANKSNARFLKMNQKWLQEEFEVPKPILETPEDVTVETSMDEPVEKPYETLSERQRLRVRRSLEAQLEGEPVSKLIKVIPEVVTSQGVKLEPKVKRDFEFVVSSCLTTPTRASKMASCIRTAGSPPTPYTAEEALALIIDNKFTKDGYIGIRQGLIDHGYSPYPPYHRVKDAKKDCYPSEELYVTEREASVSLQGLLAHTFQRIVKVYDAAFNAHCNALETSEIHCEFEVSWGFDGSTGQSLYKQRLDGKEDDHSLFATTMIPLRIITDKNQVIWLNPAPQSYRSCRPLHLQFRKESKELILSERKWVDDQIEKLVPVSAQTSEGHLIVAISKLTLSVIDGKVLNIILDTPSQLRCPYCKGTASQFNNLSLVTSLPTIKEAFKHGISPLHAWIRVLEFLLHLGYKNDPEVQKWRISQSSPAARIVEQRKKRIQDEVRQKLGLLVDIVRPNSGTTNDGNTARRALSDKNRAVFADILGVEKWLLDDLHVILVVISSGLPIDSAKFGSFCRSVAEKYVSTYGWFYMPVTIHKILVHGQEIIESSALPVGMLSEQAGEARNKYWRHDREHHTRKSHREKTMIDLFHRALESSDPVISDFRLVQRQKQLNKLPIPSAAISLLRPPIVESIPAEEPDERTLPVAQVLEGNHREITDDTTTLAAETALFSDEVDA